DQALECNLRIGRHRQSGSRHGDDVDGLAENAARRLVLALLIGNLQASQHELGGMHSHHHGHRASLIAVVIFGHDDAAVLARRHHDSGDVGTLGLDAVAAAVDPAGIGIFHDYHAGGADEWPAVVLVPDRGWDFLQVDVCAFEHVV